MKKTIITLMIFIGIIFLAGCSINEEKSTKNQKISINNDIKIEKNGNFPDYLKLENGKLFCEHGDKNDPNPNVGLIYSKQIIDTVEFPNSLEIIDFNKAKDKKNTYMYEVVCTEGIPGNCSCEFIKLNSRKVFIKKENRNTEIKTKNDVHLKSKELLLQTIDNVDIGKSIIGLETKDNKGNNIIIYLPNSFNKDGIKIKDGINYGKPENYDIITNNFIEITYPEKMVYRQTIEIKPVEEINTVMVFNPDEMEMTRTPYTNLDNGGIEFRVEPVNSKVIFALMFISE